MSCAETKQKLSVLLLCGWLMLVAGCSKIKALLPHYSDNRIEVVELIATRDANQFTAVATDVVFIFDETLSGQVAPLTARKWFDQKNHLQFQYPGKLVVFSHELVPSSHVVISMKKNKSRFTKDHRKAFKVVAFANYIDESNDYTLNISPFKKPIITHGKTKLTIVEGKKS